MVSTAWILFVATLASTATAAGADEPATKRSPNVLFIVADDLNHWIGCLGRNPQAKTPHIDRLAARGLLFTRAYCAAPVCNPSRAAVLSGLRPSTSGIYDNSQDWRRAIAEEMTLPSRLRKAGYFVAGAGKIYHGGFDRRSEWDDTFTRGGGAAGRPSQKRAASAAGGGVGAIRYARLEGGDEAMGDHAVVSWVAERLAEKHEKPFFLACGLSRPHLPWNVPKKYFDHFPLDGIQLPPFKADDLDDIPAAGVKMAGPQGDHAAVVKAGIWKEAVQAYLASIAFADHEVGRLLDALDRGPNKDDTIVCFWGDHGWHLGEKSHWRKFALWEEATRAPLIWVAPGVTKPGTVCDRTVDFMSIYPTLAELCRVPVPEHVEGASIKHLLIDPKASWEMPAVTTHLRGNHAIRTEGWRYIRYADGGEELYDEAKDPYEWTNLAQRPDFAAKKSELARFLPSKDASPAADVQRAKADKKRTKDG